MKALTASSVIGLQALPGYVSVAVAQSQLPPVEVSGSSSGGGSGCWPNCTGLYSGGSRNGGGGSSSIPENEAQGGPPAPPPAKNVAEELRKCDGAEAGRVKFLTDRYEMEKQQCVSAASSWEWSGVDFILKFVGHSCLDRAVKRHDEERFESNLLKQQCVNDALKP